ncbi:MAG TPA: carbohydrate-binding family 9-like protein, partial [Byssovorax sp.]
MKRAVVAIAAFVIAASACNGPPKLTAEQKAMLKPYILDEVPPGMSMHKIDFDHKVEIVAVDVSPRMARYPAGSKIHATILWHALARVGDGYQLFAHLNTPSGALVANLDASGPLRHMDGVSGQPLPPSVWETNKYFKDELDFTIPESAPAQVVLAVGVFKGADRLLVDDGKTVKNGEADVARMNVIPSSRNQPIKDLDAVKLDPSDVITVDGSLGEEAWKRAAVAGPFVDVGSGKDNPNLPAQGSARLLWDSTFLYVGFEVSDRHVRGGWPKDAKDAHLWEKDTCEMMLDPDGDGDNKDYYEIQINPQNLVFDTQYDDYNSPNGNGKGPFGHEEWSAQLTSAVQVHGTIDDDSDQDHGYTVEAKIP